MQTFLEKTRAFLILAFSIFLFSAGPSSAQQDAGDSEKFVTDMLENAQRAYNAGDYGRAFTLTRTAAETGNSQAQFNLGVLYSEGKGTRRSYATATKWFLKAADQGHRGAMINAAVILEKGLGGVRDLQFAADLRRMAGNPDAAKPAAAPPAASPTEKKANNDGTKEPTPTRTRLFVGLALSAALLAAGFVLHQRSSRPREPLDRVLKRINDPATPPAKAYDAFWRYKNEGGDIAAIPAERLHQVFFAAGRQVELLDIKGFTLPQSMSLAKRFSESGRHDEALKFIFDDAVLQAIARQEDSVHDAVRLLERAGRLQDIPARLAKAPAPVSVAFAKALIWVGKSAICMHLLKGRNLLSPEEEHLLELAQAPESTAAPTASQHAAPIPSDQMSRAPGPTMSIPSDPRMSLAPAPLRSLLGGKYELGAILGEGGMGIVYEGFEPRLKRKVAIKRMRSEIRSDPRVRQKFIDEAQMIAKVKHPYIVGILDIVDEGGELYLIFDHVEGRTLADMLRERGRLNLTECKEILRYVCEAVDFAHRLNVMHRDLKPANIIINKEGFPMVMDFGLARETKETMSRVTSNDTSGSPAYMSPEQHLGRAHRSSDIYSLGAMLYEMLTGKLPFIGSDLLSQKERRLYAPPSTVDPNIPPSCDKLLALAMDPDPNTRLDNAMTFHQLLKAA